MDYISGPERVPKSTLNKNNTGVFKIKRLEYRKLNSFIAAWRRIEEKRDLIFRMCDHCWRDACGLFRVLRFPYVMEG